LRHKRKNASPGRAFRPIPARFHFACNLKAV
jgi:hypothetical protein